ncbi:MAG: hypothetical protein AAF940_06410 [Pseudomonadota bacterium]
MAHLDYSERFEEGRIGALVTALGRLTADWVRARARRYRKVTELYERRDAFKTLLTKEDWVLSDMGVQRSDVEYLSRQPLHVNAAEELERLRARSMSGR